jgi:hypothetical protein
MSKLVLSIHALKVGDQDKLGHVEVDSVAVVFFSTGRMKPWSCHDIVNIDESRFYLNEEHEFIWLQPDQEIPERGQNTLRSEQTMLTIIWNPSGFRLINVLPSGFKFNANQVQDIFLAHSPIGAELSLGEPIENRPSMPIKHVLTLQK